MRSTLIASTLGVLLPLTYLLTWLARDAITICASIIVTIFSLWFFLAEKK